MAIGAVAITEDLIVRVANAVSSGAKNDDVAGALGINRSTFYRWIARGREAQSRLDEGVELTDEEARYARLFREVEKAQFTAKVEALAIIRLAIRGWDEIDEFEELDPTTNELRVVKRTKRHRFSAEMALKFLERAYPQEWGRINRLELSGPEGTPIRLEERAAGIADEFEAWLATQIDQEAREQAEAADE